MSTKSLMIAAAAAFATLAGGIGAANAHGHGNHFYFNQHHGLRIIGGGDGYGYDSCGYLFNKWQYSGSYYWKRQFLLCKYGY